MKSTLTAILSAIAIIGLIYGSWQINRVVHYKLSYRDQVAEQIKPLENRVDNLEKRIKLLEIELKNRMDFQHRPPPNRF